MQPQQKRVRNVILGIMFFSWGVLRIISAEEPADRWTCGQLAPAVLHFLGSWLFFSRDLSTREGTTSAVVSALPSFIVGGIMTMLVEAPSTWPIVANVLFVLGALGTIVSLFTLGKSFAIFPALRKLVNRGPYRLVRHPAYVCEIIMLVGVCFAASDNAMYCWMLLPVAVGFFVLRLVTEEKLLCQSSSYREYQKSVRYRLIPGVW